MSYAGTWRAQPSLPVQLATVLRDCLNRGEWAAGERLPTEMEMVEKFGLSRATVRQALKTLEAQGLVETHRGRGTFVTDGPLIRAGVEELRSVTQLISGTGHTPEVEYHHRKLRPASQHEADVLDIEVGSPILDIQVRILADGVVVAYSYDILPRWVFPEKFRAQALTGSVVAYIEGQGGPVSHRAVAHVHAVRGREIAWDLEFGDDQSFVLFDQLVYNRTGRPIMHSRTYFVEGRFNFTIVRQQRDVI